MTRAYRPQTNGKAERFIQSMLREWAYKKLYTSNGARLRDLPRLDRLLQSTETSHQRWEAARRSLGCLQRR